MCSNLFHSLDNTCIQLHEEKVRVVTKATMEDSTDSSICNGKRSHQDHHPAILFIVAPMNDHTQAQYREQEIIRGKMVGANFLKAAFKKVAHHTYAVCDNYNDLKQAVERFSEQVNEYQQSFIVFITHGSDDGYLIFRQELHVRYKDVLNMTDNAFRRSRPEKMRKWPVRCIFANCYSHMVAPSCKDMPSILRHSEVVEFACTTTGEFPVSWIYPRFKPSSSV